VSAHRTRSREAPSCAYTRSVFLRAVGVVYVCAFLSLHWQIVGLLGSDGLLPAAAFLERAARALGTSATWQLPTLFWLGASDFLLHAACVAGAVSAVLVALGIAPLATLATCWLLYLSLVGVGQQLLSYQWDALLLETGFLAILWAPLAWRLDAADARRPSPIVLWLLRWLLFRLMFFSGFVKLASGDPAWWSLDALSVHFVTQPLPTWTAWWAHQLPSWLLRLACLFMFVIELVLPFLIVLGRRARLVAFVGLVGLQAGIAATGNYGFFNLLSAVLCLPLLDDAQLARMSLRRHRGDPTVGRREHGWKLALDSTLAILLLALSLPPALERLTGVRLDASLAPLAALQRAAAPFQLTSTYGLFAVMTTRRPEITIEGAVDGTEWRPYVFRSKPGPLDRRPAFVGTGMPRLDWQMWFDALYVERMLAGGRGGANLITPVLLERLRAGSPAVLGLLDGDPFDGARPTALRWRLDDYRFTDRAERDATGDWWKRTPLHEEPPR